MKVFLCGMPKAGKSTLAKELGALLNRAVIDTDREIEHYVRQEKGQFFSCRQICTQFGHNYFREVESGILKHINLPDNAIVALGGGFVMRESTRSLTKALGKVVYLYADVEFLWKRMALDLSSMVDAKRPYESFQELFAQRHPVFAEFAHLTIQIDNPIQPLTCQLRQYIMEWEYGQ